jgi:hypothetical protein
MIEDEVPYKVFALLDWDEAGVKIWKLKGMEQYFTEDVSLNSWTE